MYHTCRSWNPGWWEIAYAGSAKSSRRSAEAASGGSVLPMPWKTLELTKTIPEARKFQQMMRRYSDPKATTPGSALKKRIMPAGAISHSSVSTNMIAALMAAAE